MEQIQKWIGEDTKAEVWLDERYKYEENHNSNDKEVIS